MNYYLLIRDKRKLDEFHREFIKRRENMENGITPVFNEVRSAKTNMIESLPYNIIAGAFLIIGTIVLNKLGLNEIISIAVVVIMNSLMGAIANYIFTIFKDNLRKKFLNRIHEEYNEKNIGVLESLEYQACEG